MTQLAFVFDPDRCIGCNACRVSCQQHNHLAPDTSFRMVTAHERGRFPDVAQHNLSVACNHCERPACVAVCPVGAMNKRASDGVVWIDRARCNDCARCVGAYPYGAPQPSPTGVVKCDLCSSRTLRDDVPVCVETCVGGALGFSTLAELDARADVSKTVEGFPDPTWTQSSTRFVVHPRRDLGDGLFDGDGG